MKESVSYGQEGARVGRRVPRHVYWRGEPLFTAATPELAAEIVSLLNVAQKLREPTVETVSAGVGRFSDLLQAGVGSEYLMTETLKAVFDAALAEPTAPR